METLILTEADSLALIADGSYNLPVQVHGVLRDPNGVLTPFNTLTIVPTTDQVTILPAPVAGKMYLVKEILIHKATGGDADVSLRLLRGNNVYPLFVGTVAAGKTYRLSDNLSA